MEWAVEWLNELLYDNRALLMGQGILFVAVIIVITIWENYTKKGRKYTVGMLGNNIAICCFLIIIGKIGNIVIEQSQFAVEVRNEVFYKWISVMFMILLIRGIYQGGCHYRRYGRFNLSGDSIELGHYLLSATIIISTGYEEIYLWITCIAYVVSDMLKFLVIIRNDESSNKKLPMEQELYEGRRVQLDAVWNDINKPVQEAKCIAINGEWGLGKTYFIETLLDRVEESEHQVIYISALCLEDSTNLITIFENKLMELFEANNLDIGNASGIRRYFEAVFKMMQIEEGIQPFFKNSKQVSYSEGKKNFQLQLDYLLKRIQKHGKEEEKNLVVVIDDFDRLEESKRKDVLSFINQIFNLRGMLIILGLDFKNIDEQSILNKAYVEKFIDKTVVLATPSIKEILANAKLLIGRTTEIECMQSMCERIPSKLNIQYKIVALIQKNIDEIENTHKDEVQREEKKEYLKDFILRVQTDTSNPRKIKHFVEDVDAKIAYMNELFKRYKKVEEVEKVNRLFESIDVGEVIIIIAYIEVFLKEQFYEIVNAGGILGYLKKSKNVDNGKEIIRILFRDGLCEVKYFSLCKEVEERKRVSNIDMLIKGFLINESYIIKGIEFRTNIELLDEIIRDDMRIHELRDDSKDVYETFNYVQDQKYNDVMMKFNDYVTGEIYISKTLNPEIIVDILRSFNIYTNRSIIEVFVNFLDLSIERIGEIGLEGALIQKLIRILEKNVDDVAVEISENIQCFEAYLEVTNSNIQGDRKEKVLNKETLFEQLRANKLIKESDNTFIDIQDSLKNQLEVEQINKNQQLSDNEQSSLECISTYIQSILKLGCKIEDFAEVLQQDNLRAIDIYNISTKEEVERALADLEKNIYTYEDALGRLDYLVKAIESHKIGDSNILNRLMNMSENIILKPQDMSNETAKIYLKIRKLIKRLDI